MKRRKLQRLIAVCILDTQIPLRFQSMKRAVTSTLLLSYSIRKETTVTDTDRMKALEIAINAIKSKPTIYRTAPHGSPIAKERRNYILSGLADP